MAISQYGWDYGDMQGRQMLESILAFERAKLIQTCPYQRPRPRIKKSVDYKYDPNESDHIQVFADMTKWRR